MVWTFKLTNGGFSFDSDGKISMVGIMNRISKDEVRQRMGIRLQTQKRSNVLHPFDGFDKEMINQSTTFIESDGTSYGLENVIELAIREALLQDPDIAPDSTKITFLGAIDRTYSVQILYQIKGKDQESSILQGQIPAI